MNRWQKTAGTALLLVMVTAAPAWAAERTLPTSVTVDGHAVTFDQQPLLRDGVLMVPLRAVVEAAGGQVQWDGALQKIVVTLGDRTAVLAIGTGHATTELTQVKQQTPVQMARQPELAGGRTLISADALSSVLGLLEQSGQDGTMALQAAPAAAAPAPAESSNAGDKANAQSGTIQQVEAGEVTRILVAGAPMANGEPRLTWVTVTAETRITVQEQGQERAGTAADLKAGQQVDVLLTGGVLMSYPARATGRSIMVRQ